MRRTAGFPRLFMMPSPDHPPTEPASAASESAAGDYRQRGWRSFARLSTRIGLEGKILAALMLLLTLALGSTCWVWANRINIQVTDIMGEQARQIAYTLALAAKPSLTTGDANDLRLIGRDLLKARNILFVSFYDSNGNNIALADRAAKDPLASAPLRKADVASLMRVRLAHSPTMGDYLQVCSPVLDVSDDGEGSRLIGYVSVGVSLGQEQMQVARVNFLAAAIGGIFVLASLPLAFALVHRIFWPIRQLVAATNRIAAGELNAQVAMHRPDAIGDLARAFNQMVRTVKRQATGPAGRQRSARTGQFRSRTKSGSSHQPA